jgi:hypothetical protein
MTSKESFYDRRFHKVYILKYTKEFLQDYWLTIWWLKDNILYYLQNHYLVRQEKYFSVAINKQNRIAYHKIETTVSNNKSRKHWWRTLAFFVFFNDSDIAFITPAFFFPVQEEKTYTTNILISPQFGKKLLQRLEHYSKYTQLQEIITDIR